MTTKIKVTVPIKSQMQKEERLMKIKRNHWEARRLGRIAAPLLAFLVAFGMVMAMPGLNGEAGAVDFDKACSLTVHPGNEALAGDLEKAGVVIDLYQVAGAEPVAGHDTYTYSFADAYKSLEGIYGENPTDADWTAMAQGAAKAAKDGGVPAVTGAAVGQPMEGLKCGLYLVIARGSSLEEYWTSVTAEDGTEEVATIAASPAYTYTYMPTLVSLPSKEAEDGVINTAGPGEWLYQMDVTLKPSQALRHGSLEIVKTLQAYETKDPATFVFDVEAVLDGNVVYSNVVSITFTEAGQKKTILEGIPVGAEVTVEEVYSGASYTLVSEGTQTATIVANEVASVAFTNDYDETNRGGGSVTNHFANSEEEGWGWTPIPDSGADR